MTRPAILVILVGLLGVGAGFWIREEAREPAGGADRGPAGIEFVVPSGYEVLELGESTLESASAAVAARLGPVDRIAAVFTWSGDRIHLLVDPSEGTLEQHLVSRYGTVRRLLWQGQVAERLAWAAEHGSFDAPGTSPAEARNPYH